MRQHAAAPRAHGKTGQPRTVASRKYIYAIIDGISDFSAAANGIDGRRPELISAHGITCVVSENASEHLRPERRHLTVHRDILNWLMARSSAVLPVRFGTIADSESGVRTLLSQNRDDLLRQLGRVRGKVEMGLRVTWDVPNIFEFFVDHKPELRAERDRLLSRRGENDRD
jgi:hypothetical protein